MRNLTPSERRFLSGMAFSIPEVIKQTNYATTKGHKRLHKC